MKKLFLTATILALFVATPAMADWGNHNERDFEHGREHVERGHEHGIYGEHRRDGGDHWRHGYDRHILHEYHGWIWAFPPPMWLPLDPFCREYTIFNTYSDGYGGEYTVEETHIECLDVFGRWQLVQ
jgi:hypothetical protein